VTSTKRRDNYEGTAERSVKKDRKGKIEGKGPRECSANPRCIRKRGDAMPRIEDLEAETRADGVKQPSVMQMTKPGSRTR
jgi:hypothetical protein